MSTRRPSIRRTPRRGRERLAATGAALATAAAMLAIVPAPAAVAGPAPTPTPAAFTRTAAGDFSGVVPGGVCAVQVQALGAAGGSSIAASNTNGAGARVNATYAVTPGTEFSGTVGAAGNEGTNRSGGMGPGGAPGGGDGGPADGRSNAWHHGAGGGGYTSVTIGGTEAVVAGGGGGSGGGHTPAGTTYGFGGNAGLPTGPGVAPGQNGFDGWDGTTQQGGGGTVGGGQGGQATAGGAGGTHSTSAARNGTAGSGRTGGNGGHDPGADSGAGGGGGYFAGGGGASTVLSNSDGGSTGISGAGGGGGASFVAPSVDGAPARAVSSSAGDKRNGSGLGSNGAVTLTWVLCDYDLAVTKAVTGPATDTGLATWTVSVTNNGPDDMAVGDTVTLTDSLPGPAATEITALTTPGGVSCRVDGSVLSVGDRMGSPVECSRADGSGLADGESISVTYTQRLVEPANYSNTASVTDRSSTTGNNTSTASTRVTGPATDNGTSEGRRGVEQRWTPTPTPGTYAVDCADTLTLLDADGDPVSTLTVPNVGTYAVDDCAIVFTPVRTYQGTPPPVRYRVTDGQGNHATGTYTPTVVPADPPSTNSGVTSGPQGIAQSWEPAPQAGRDFDIDWSTLTLLDSDGDPATTVVVAGQGTYSIDGRELVFTPLPTFVGTADPVDYRISDEGEQSARGTYTPTLTGVRPTANDDSSTGRPNTPQSTAPLGNDVAGDPAVPLVPGSLTLLDGDGDPATEVTVDEGVYTIEGGRIVFTPNRNFHGSVTPVRYRVSDANGTTATATYTPDVPADAPSTNSGVTSGPQGVAQAWEPAPAAGEDFPIDWSTLTLLDSDGDPATSVVVPGQGTYTVDGRELVFTPLPTFVGTADPVVYRISDEGAQPARGTYTPTLTGVRPTANDDSSTGRPNTPQSIDPLGNDVAGDPAVPLVPGSLTLLDADGDPATEVTVPEGVYTIEDGKLVFTPNRNFHGEVTPVEYRVADANGTTTTATYTPDVPADAPTTNSGVTSGPQGIAQSWEPSPVAGEDFAIDWSTLTLLDADGDPATEVVVAGQGTYSIDGHRLVFTPLPTFVGTADPVAYRVSDEGAQRVRGTYTPTLSAVTPRAADDVSSGWWNRPQSVDPLVNDAAGDPAVPLVPGSLTLLDADGDPATEVTVPEGVYTIEDGKLVFTPKRGFTGEPTPVDYRIADANGTTTEATYRPTVRGPETSQDLVDTKVCGTPVVFDTVEEVPGLDPASVRLVDADGERVLELVVDGEGTWTVDPDSGQITFTPDGCFVGDVTSVTWEGALADGTPVTGTLSVNYVATPDEDDPVREPAPDAKDLADTGGPALGWLVASLAMIGAGGVLLRRRRAGGAR